MFDCTERINESLVKCLMLLSIVASMVFLPGTVGFDAHAQRFTARNTITLSVDLSSKDITGNINQKQRYKVIIDKAGGWLKVDRIKRSAKLQVSLYDSANNRLPFSFEEEGEVYVAPGVYVLELVNGGTGRGHYMFRLTLQPKRTGRN